jgi:hypothetical protein
MQRKSSLPPERSPVTLAEKWVLSLFSFGGDSGLCGVWVRV